mmetsp:Transcript_8601/g.17960  ORF Transcript_8601/g.17960 Transcript_8601/m.17960 type:complete len:236 (+) Transcript_8601:150-857(+)|eukprot:CAMPEP_0201136554 /NCGR_PEP_ID=MMETSP0850-20130426/54945_1 /ASSEMBLY_ACC=CAM_ASM_000622 /TAXON_ID=183588 /ORGANISM="Pseudo-nitzschia fraudulenta, Strain WWA7" /LENGTH=235 /DNA_ID=CAMNT_0047407863 /DNA_START=103 /DNA_END=810 /DNA_ORIENTATION=+
MSEISSPILQIAKSFWYDHYNADTEWYAFWIPMIFWSSCWIYAKITPGKDFGRWWEIHTVHHVGAIVLGSVSLYYDDDAIVNERIPILWSISFFIIDIVDVLSIGKVTYIAHGVICLMLGLGNYNLPLLRSLRMNSKASYIESSSIILFHVKRYRKAWLFGIFALVYTACRIIWIPFMIQDLLNNGMETSHPVVIGIGLFYCLNIHWYVKILKIAVHGPGENSSDNEGNDESKKK